MMDVRLMREGLDVGAAYAAAACAEAGGVGGVDVFVGITRREVHGEFGELEALEYEAYEEMAVAEMRRIAEEACGRWPVKRMAVWHRIGRVAAGEASVVIAVGCPHRAEAFEACRYVIDQLKARAPIWKKEVYAKGGRWQGAGG